MLSGTERYPGTLSSNLIHRNTKQLTKKHAVQAFVAQLKTKTQITYFFGRGSILSIPTGWPADCDDGMATAAVLTTTDDAALFVGQMPIPPHLLINARQRCTMPQLITFIFVAPLRTSVGRQTRRKSEGGCG